MYSEIQGDLNNFESTLLKQYDGSKSPVAFSGELLYSDGNRGTQLLGPNARAGYMRELNALKALGLKAVVTKVGFPLLYQSFLQMNGDPQDYQAYLQFYQQLVADVHAAGMKIILENTSLYPGFYTAQSGVPELQAFYKSLSFSQYTAAVAAQTAVVATQIKPDYINVGSEPDTEMQCTGQTQLNTSTGWATAVKAFLSQVPTPHPVPIGTGVGTWIVDQGQDYVKNEILQSGVDYIDLHIYPVNQEGKSSILQNTIDLINLAQSMGKQVGVSETWLLKVTAQQLLTNTSLDPTADSRNAYSFFAPLDQQFITDLYKVANWKKLLFISFFWTDIFWAQVDYNQTSSLSPSALVAAETQAAGQALVAGQTTPTGALVKTLNAGQSSSAPSLAVVSAASGQQGMQALGSIVSIYGSGLAPSTTVASALPLPTSLAGTSITVTDSAGTKQPAQLFFVSASQINALIPSALQPGAATLTVTPATGTPQSATLTLAVAAPGLFTEGNGVAAAQTLTIDGSGNRTLDLSFRCDSSGCVNQPIDLSAGDVYLLLFGTGVATGQTAQVTIGGQVVTPLHAGPQGEFPGLDQVNFRIPPSLAGAGTVNVVVTVNGTASNTVTVRIQ